MKQKMAIFLTMVGCLFFVFSSSDSYANIIIKVRALNPLESDEVASISYPLPEEVSPSDIITKKIVFSLPPGEEEEQKTTFNIEYVEAEGRYYIIDEVMLKPREVVTLEVHVKDIWVIPVQRLESMKQAVEDLIAQYPPAEEVSLEEPSEEEAESVEEAESEEEAESVEDVPDETTIILQKEIFQQIDAIAARQPESSVLKVGVEKHMEAYYENMEALAQVEVDVEMLRYLLEPEEEEGEEGAEEGVDVQEELPAEEETLKEETPEEEILEEETPLAGSVDLTSEDGALEPESNIAE